MEDENDIVYKVESVTKASPIPVTESSLSSSSAEVLLQVILVAVKKFRASNAEVQPRPWKDPEAIQIKDWLHGQCPQHLLVMMWQATSLPYEGNKAYPGLGNV